MMEDVAEGISPQYRLRGRHAGGILLPCPSPATATRGVWAVHSPPSAGTGALLQIPQRHHPHPPEISDLRRVVQTLPERNYKKYDLQLKQLKDNGKARKIPDLRRAAQHHLGYELEGGEKEFRCLNYYTNEEITIPWTPSYPPRTMPKSISTSTTSSSAPTEALVDLTRNQTRD